MGGGTVPPAGTPALQGTPGPHYQRQRTLTGRAKRLESALSPGPGLPGQLVPLQEVGVTGAGAWPRLSTPTDPGQGDPGGLACPGLRGPWRVGSYRGGLSWASSLGLALVIIVGGASAVQMGVGSGGLMVLQPPARFWVPIGGEGRQGGQSLPRPPSPLQCGLGQLPPPPMGRAAHGTWVGTEEAPRGGGGGRGAHWDREDTLPRGSPSPPCHPSGGPSGGQGPIPSLGGSSTSDHRVLFLEGGAAL